jgi:hypothetical protein
MEMEYFSISMFRFKRVLIHLRGVKRMWTAQKINNKVREGEVYYASDEVIAQARLKGWEAMAAKALEDLLAFWTNPPRRRIQ